MSTSSRLIHTQLEVLCRGLVLIQRLFGWILRESTLSDGFINSIFEMQLADLA